MAADITLEDPKSFEPHPPTVANVVEEIPDAPAPAFDSDETASLLDAVRGFGVVVGPSIAFHAITLGSLPALLVRRL